MNLMVNLLIDGLRHQFQQMPDPRSGGNTQFSFGDIGMATFSVFFVQSPSFPPTTISANNSMASPGNKTETRHYRWASHMPLNDSSDALQVNWLSIEIVRKRDGKVTNRNSFITNLELNRDNVEQLAASGRARWKIENESFNLLKNNGYHMQHNFGHGHQGLSNLLLTLNLLAFTFHTTCD